MEFEGRSRITQQLSMAPLMDVMLLLLVFFMLTSTFLAADVIDLELPRSSSSRPVNDLDIVVLLSADGRLAVNGEFIEMDELQARLRELLVEPVQQLVTLKTDSEESVQDMLSVMDIIREAGGQKVFLATERKD
jgi:biopolymer transport protein ExbD/biopolymer transport protein TolR